MHRLTKVVAAGAAMIVVVLVLTAVLRPASGPLALLGIFAPHLALVGIVIAVPAALAGPDDRAMQVTAIALVVIALARFGSEWAGSSACCASHGSSSRT